MELIDGNEIASAVIEELTERVARAENHKPCVAFLRVGEDPASVSYVSKKQKNCG
jgi:methylenetetrahydrofolate dehydrogenase (NADP+)/methenyltetrahydrofolate cyclohydrolase